MIEPVSALVSGYVAEKIIDRVTKSFKINVIERWTKARAEKFFNEFCREIELELAGHQSDELDILLEKILEDETRSEVLFNAYRHVCFSRSKNLGPRIIGVLTAQLVIEGRLADEAEDNIFMAAENLLDNELLEFAEFTKKYKSQAEDEKIEDVSFDDHGNLAIEWFSERIDSNWNRDTNLSLAPLDLVECLGKWALKIKSLGIISDDLKERQWDYSEDDERHIDEPGRIREISWWIYMSKSYFKLADLIERVSRDIE